MIEQKTEESFILCYCRAFRGNQATTIDWKIEKYDREENLMNKTWQKEWTVEEEKDILHAVRNPNDHRHTTWENSSKELLMLR